ncbi:hypothetical protein [Actinacidiphila epipremni]|uniref:Secreted protein n=1 Tax=Actinacidiphila epipremni TaxID=2053013 RepID=A0ABX0ZIE7_9ACTN|nr:hypothetical protein [Actinacidiphila epipremni]NJP42577.1 hypothetical protein [Actinacidiphila epipremni]
MRYGHRVSSAWALAAATALLVSGCGGGGGGGDKPSDQKHKSSAKTGGSPTAGADDGADTPSPTPTKVLAQIKGAENMSVTINSASRDDGGFLTVEGSVTNDGDEPFTADLWVGSETAVAKSGASVAGALLVDEAGKKRYYVLRDTDGRCLCTMGLVDIEPKESRPFFAQFPSPPPTTTEVEFELPTMPPAKITISEG